MIAFARTLVGVLGAAAVLASPPGRAQDLAPELHSDPDFGTTLEAEELVSAALSRSPTLPAAEAAVRAARERARQVGALEDPMAAVMVAPLSLGGGDAALGYEVRASQRLPYPGKRPLRRAVATAEAEGAEQELAQARLDVATSASTLFADYHLVAEHQEVVAEHVALLEAFQRVATARYAAGLAPQQAPLQAELELGEMLQEQVSLRARERVLRAQINALLHRAADAPLPPPAPLDLPSSPPTASLEVTKEALTGRPEARAQQAEVAARRAALDLTRRGLYPDLELMAGYSSMWDMPEHRLVVGAGVNLPFFSRRRIRAEIAEAEARVAEAEAEQQRIDDTFQARLAEATASTDEASQHLQLFRDRVLPAARDQVEAARAAFESGEQPMLALIEAERGLRSAELGYHEVVAAYLRQAAEVERQLGRLPTAIEIQPTRDQEREQR